MKSDRRTKAHTASLKAATASPPLAMKVGAESQPEQFLTTETLALEFQKRGLPVPHRNTLLLAEKNLRFPARFHLGGPWSPALWRKSEVESFFAEAAQERPPQRWRPRAELERELVRLRGAS